MEPSSREKLSNLSVYSFGRWVAASYSLTDLVLSLSWPRGTPRYGQEVPLLHAR